MSECTYCHAPIEGVRPPRDYPNVVMLYAHKTCQAEHQKTCPTCNDQPKVPFFSVLKLPGYVCDHCHMFYDTNMKPLAFLP